MRLVVAIAVACTAVLAGAQDAVLDCGKLDPVAHATADVSLVVPVPVNSTVTFTCDKNYYVNGMEGHKTINITCFESGFPPEELAKRCLTPVQQPRLTTLDGNLILKAADGTVQFELDGLALSVHDMDQRHHDLEQAIDALTESTDSSLEDLHDRVDDEAATRLADFNTMAESLAATESELASSILATKNALTADVSTNTASDQSTSIAASDKMSGLRADLSTLQLSHDFLVELTPHPTLSSLYAATETLVETELHSATDLIWTDLNAILHCNAKGQVYNNKTRACEYGKLVVADVVAGACVPGTLARQNGDVVVCEASGSSWAAVSAALPLGQFLASAADSCQQIKDEGFSRGNNPYFIKVNGQPAFVVCDMDQTPAKSVGGNGRDRQSFNPSCASLKTYWDREGPAWIGADYNSAKYVLCFNGQNLGGDGSSASNTGQNCGTVVKPLPQGWGKPVNNRYNIGGNTIDCNDGRSPSHPVQTCLDLVGLRTGSFNAYMTVGGGVSTVWCEMDRQGGGWTLIHSTDMSCACGSFEGGWGSPNPASNYRFPVRGNVMSNMFVRNGGADFLVQTRSGRESVITGAQSLNGLSGTCTSCNCGGNSLGGGVYWHGGRGRCYSGAHYGFSVGTNNNHNTCGSSRHWGHFHRGGVNRGVYQFDKTCINENEWQERYVVYVRSRQ